MFEDQQPEDEMNLNIDNNDSDIINNNAETEPLLNSPEINPEINPEISPEITNQELPNLNPEPQMDSMPMPDIFAQDDYLKEQNVQEESPVTVQPVKFASFDEEENIHGKENKNLDLLMNVNLQMSVELGRTELPFKKVLELTRGSIISLDKLAGEPVELFANGKLVAFGEVVVIEDNFGLRITSIAAPEERLKTVHESSNS